MQVAPGVWGQVVHVILCAALAVGGLRALGAEGDWLRLVDLFLRIVHTQQLRVLVAGVLHAVQG